MVPRDPLGSIAAIGYLMAPLDPFPRVGPLGSPPGAPAKARQDLGSWSRGSFAKPGFL
jgi:hypothetical protein